MSQTDCYADCGEHGSIILCSFHSSQARVKLFVCQMMKLGTVMLWLLVSIDKLSEYNIINN